MLEAYQRSSGLLVAGQAAAPDHVRKQLRQIRDDLRLGVEVDEHWGCYVFKVLSYQGESTAAVWLFDWRQDMEDPSSAPLPLSSGILTEAASRLLDSRRQFEDPHRANLAREERERVERVERYADGFREAFRRGRRSPVLHRSQSLRMARDKQRARGEKL